jgi:hypothetical protein
MIRRAFKLFLYTSALGFGALLANTMVREVVVGSGNPATEERMINPITEVVHSGVGNLTVIQGDVPGLSVTADDNVLPFLETHTSGRKLIIRNRSGYSIQTQVPISYTLTVPRLEKLSVSGAGSVKSDRLMGDNLAVRLSGAANATLREVHFKTLTVSLSGAGRAALSGSSDQLTARISGSGEIDAGNLKTRTTEVRVSGAGNAGVWATDALNVRVSGAGNVKYKGEPKIEKKVSGAGNVKPE